MSTLFCPLSPKNNGGKNDAYSFEFPAIVFGGEGRGEGAKRKGVVIELDGAYHDATYDADHRCEKDLRRKGWDVIRFSNDEVLDDVEAVAIAISKQLGLTPGFARPPHPNPLPQTAGENASNDTQRSAPAIRGRGGKKV